MHAQPVHGGRGAQKRTDHPWCTHRHPPRTGQPVDGLPADLAEQELGFSRIQLDKLRQRPAPVRPPQPIPDDAPASDRLAALLGRTSVPLGDDGELRVVRESDLAGRRVGATHARPIPEPTGRHCRHQARPRS